MTDELLRTRPGPLVWAGRCLAALAVFHVAMGALLYANLDQVVTAFTGTVIGRSRSDAETSAWGGVAVHLILAVICLVLARRIPRGRRSTRIRTSLLMTVNVIAGIAAMWLPSQTYLSPLGVAIALATLVLLWRQGLGLRR